MEIDFSNLHHAYVVLGNPSSSREELGFLLQKYDLVSKNSPDYFEVTISTFGVDDARDVSRRAYTKAFGERKIFVLSSDIFTWSSQNALLKTLEEPSPNTHFFILGRNEEDFLPTLLSRAQVVRMNGVGTSSSRAKEFLKMSPSKRIDFAKEFSETEESLQGFIDDLLLELRESKDGLSKVGDVNVVRKYGGDISVAKRLIIEHLALVL